ncbi:MAG: HAD family hydrolase [Anaerolineae bacterium]|nr:HAD family hydrolase [Anaerolineae bacterium]
MNWAVFLDRDGTINREVNYLSDPADLALLPGAAEGIHLLNNAGVPVILITNQSAIGRGYFSAAQLDKIHATLAHLLAEQHAYVNATYYCPHHPDAGCLCRKPHPGLLLQAATEQNLNLHRSFMIGDKTSDLEAGQRAGCRTILVLTGYGVEHQEILRKRGFPLDFTAHSLLEAATWILDQPHNISKG